MNYIMLLLAVCPTVLLINDLPAVEDPRLEAACEGRWPGRYIELNDVSVYDCNNMAIINKSSLPSCDDESTEECV